MWDLLPLGVLIPVGIPVVDCDVGLGLELEVRRNSWWSGFYFPELEVLKSVCKAAYITPREELQEIKQLLVIRF